tara:strand:+ start:8611 stop:9771 length:1161 start_codon:yes stop_codon:yes gene_type:complete
MITALSEYLVLDLTTNLPGPYCSMLLSDLGAKIIKVEPPKGDPLRRFPSEFASINRGKRDIVIDLKTDQGKKLINQLITKADVVLEGFRPGVSKRLGIDYKSAKTLNSKLVYCSISGYGQKGPYKTRPGHDINYLAIGGMLGRSNPPMVPPILISDLSSGLYAALAISAALIDKASRGKGNYIDLSMTDCILSWMSLDFASVFNGSHINEQPILENIPHYGIFKTSDSKFISLGIVHEDHFWIQLCDILDLDSWKNWPLRKRLEDDAMIREKLKNIFATNSCEEWNILLSQADVPFAPIYDLDELKEDPYIKYRKPFYSLFASDHTESHQIKPPYRMSQSDDIVPLPPPTQGEHSRQILAECGYTEDEINHLIQLGVIHESMNHKS